ncbi:cytochrome P450 [Lentinus tigrinus ALCF2SS1-7]|uniref:Cytochrome P450 n=1 Tax=Lentinus tigrinus ALCF2SS1-6 TaxID=1328759 RepID=A0A5C2S6S6_9APHY|nr:cytochrome P450 [Lentinus tigrinus ALCF2SS1-6]RPD68922.1 cytochrome P450 [Lentinus tigrinus ALCF2SS1-7]
MALTFDPLWLSASVLAVSVFALLYLKRRRNALPLPPGPPGWPIIGNVFDYPQGDLAEGLFELHKRYGPLVHLSVFGKSTISIGSYEAACDLLDKRSANYSDRPTLLIGELTDIYHWNFPLMSYGPGWRARRRILHHELLPDSITKYRHYQLHVTHGLLRNLLASPKEFKEHLQRTFSAVALLIAYGLEPQGDDDKYIGMLHELNVIGANLCVPGKYLVESLPILQYLPSWFPGAGFKRHIAPMKRRMREITSGLWQAGKQHLEEGAENDSVLATIVRKAANLGKDAAAEEEAMGAGIATTIYTAGGDTTANAALVFFLAMALYPEVQKKAQEELDRVVGPTRLPDFTDRDSLPYVNALVKEVLRWHVGTPTSLPHSSIKDDVYNGYFIPGGSIVLPNLWGFAKDPEIYPEPRRFNPDRFHKDGRINEDVRDPATIIFGFGRRVCPGQHMATASLFITCASVLHAFTITPPLDERGKPVPMEAKFVNNSITSEPEKFDCEIRPRSPEKALLIEQLVD